MIKLLGKYNNGNFETKIYSDGTKVRVTDDDNFIASFAENIDIKICNYCDMNCSYCHEGSSINGTFGDILNEKFIDSLRPYQEVAIGGGNPLSHPDLVEFLKILWDKKVIANITVNQVHFMNNQKQIKMLADSELIKGIGVSLVNANKEFLDTIKMYPNAVIHVINGIVTSKQIQFLSHENLKILILGYKTLRKGDIFLTHNTAEITKNKDWLYEHIGNIINCSAFKVVSFDNLAIDQLSLKRIISDKQWDTFYMGDDGTMTFYIDMVNRTFSQSSTSPINGRYTLLDNVDEMFNVVLCDYSKNS